MRVLSTFSVTLLIATVTLIAVSWKGTTDKAAASARKIQGLYIFSDCTPVSDYQVLGTVSRNPAISFKSSQYENIRDMLIKKAKDQYPMGEGLILDLRDGGTDKADVIKFK